VVLITLNESNDRFWHKKTLTFVTDVLFLKSVISAIFYFVSPGTWKITNAKRTSAKELKQVLQDGQLCLLNAGMSMILRLPQFCATSAASIQQLARKCQGRNIAQNRSWERFLWQIEITSQLILKSRPRVNVLRRKWNARNHQKVKEDGREKDINTEHLQVSHQKRLLCHKVVCDCTLPFCFTLYRISFIYSLVCIRLFFKKGLFITTVVTRICFFITEKQVRKVWWKIHHNMCGCRQIYADKDSLRITELDRNIPPISTKELCRYLN